MQAISQKVHDLVDQGEDLITIHDEITVACTAYTTEYLAMLRQGHWSAAHAHDVLKNTWNIDELDLMQISGLARALQIYQSTN